MTFKILTLGCKVNAYESEVIKEKLLNNKYTENNESPNIIIINTCSVTNIADTKSMKYVRRLKRENPNAILVVCGCSVQNDMEKFTKLGANIVIGNTDKSKIVELIQNYIDSKEDYYHICSMQNLEFEDMDIKNFNHVRAYIKIQDGCNNYCSYCIIPYLRGNLRCKEYKKVLSEASKLVENGHKEIVLTGIHTGSYNDSNHDLCDLILDLLKIDGLERIRLSSIEITEINNDKFYNLLKNNTKLCDHLHIPLQAGSNEILKRMNRKYDLKYYEDVINKIRSIRPNIAISTDCLVGHPYETDELFQESLDFCKKIEFSKIHVFPYSIRKGTAASRMPNQVSEKEKRDRATKLIMLSNDLEKKYQEKFVGQTLDILVEKKDGDYICGHTSNMLMIKEKGLANINDIVSVKIKKDNYE
jgi:threonylcarbamoyladenosine tRNA methylthiotransferase MtaB